MNIYVVDAFTDKLFSGNPAAVCPLKEWINDDLMQKIAFENNLSETAFFVPSSQGYHLRWFTPFAEVKLCGHATLASAHVLFNHLNYQQNEITFNSLSGPLVVRKNHDKITLNFPISEMNEKLIDSELLSAFSIPPIKTLKGETDYMLIYNNQSEIENIKVDYSKVKKYKARGVIITAPGDNADIVSRFFAPLHGIDEDPVTGSAHTALIPYWAKKLGKNKFSAKQLSKRGGELYCEMSDDRINITGKAITYMSGQININ